MKLFSYYNYNSPDEHQKSQMNNANVRTIIWKKIQLACMIERNSPS